MRTYGSDQAVQYAESVQVSDGQFMKLGFINLFINNSAVKLRYIWRNKIDIISGGLENFD